MQSLMQEVQHLLPLLTVSVASATNVTAAVEDLQRRAACLHSQSAESAAHLRHIQAAVHTISADSASSVEVQQCMTALRNSMLRLHGESLQKVLDGCGQMQQQLGEGLTGVEDSLYVLQVWTPQIPNTLAILDNLLECSSILKR